MARAFPNNSGKRYQQRNYLQHNRGRWRVQVPVPRDLRHRYLSRTGKPKTFVEKYLSTSDRREATRLAPAAVAAIRRGFERARQGALSAEEIRAAAQSELHRTYDFLTANPVDGPGRIDDFLFAVQGGDGETLDYDALRPRATETIERIGAEPTEESVIAMCDALVDAAYAARAMFDKNIRPPRPHGVSHSVEGGPTVIRAAEAYASDRGVTVTGKTKDQMRQTARLFADHVGHGTSVAAIDGRAAVAFMDRLAAISPGYRYDPKAGEMSLDELEERHPAGQGKGLSAATLNRHATNMRVLFDWLIRREELPHDHRNPFERKSRKVRSVDDGGDAAGYLRMVDDEIAKLLDGATLPRKPGQKFNDAIGWLVALAAYTGARAGELVALTTADVLKKDGVSFVVIPRGKTRNARRVIPLHPELIRAGFPDFARECDGRLFGIDARTLSKRFKPYREGAGVTRERVTFHSLRKSFATKLHHADVSADTAAWLLGHKANRSFTYDVYSPDGPTLRQLARAVGEVRYKGLRLLSQTR